jgi:glycosyl-4,4'-diaponeurosporenoate acyltransferase
MNAAILSVNIIAWPVIQLSIARAILYVPDRYFASTRRPTGFELREVLFYRRVLRIKRWKHLLPDGASWFTGTFSKSRISSHDSDYLLRFAREARRGELAHWCMLCSFPIFYLWNPLWACIVMTLYAVSSNLPCIFVQRYNRIVISHSLTVLFVSRSDNEGISL